MEVRAAGSLHCSVHATPGRLTIDLSESYNVLPTTSLWRCREWKA